MIWWDSLIGQIIEYRIQHTIWVDRTTTNIDFSESISGIACRIHVAHRLHIERLECAWLPSIGRGCYYGRRQTPLRHAPRPLPVCMVLGPTPASRTRRHGNGVRVARVADARHFAHCSCTHSPPQVCWCLNSAPTLSHPDQAKLTGASCGVRLGWDGELQQTAPATESAI